jgi:hypothetical protein
MQFPAAQTELEKSATGDELDVIWVGKDGESGFWLLCRHLKEAV